MARHGPERSRHAPASHVVEAQRILRDLLSYVHVQAVKSSTIDASWIVYQFSSMMRLIGPELNAACRCAHTPRMHLLKCAHRHAT